MAVMTGAKVRTTGTDDIEDTSQYWLDYFGLGESPFQTSARSSMYYPLSKWQATQAYLHKNCHGNDTLVLVMSMLGGGKTTMMRQFLEQVDRNVMICSVKADVSCAVNTLLDAMTEDFGLPVSSGKTIESRLNKYISAMDGDRSYVMVVDDAHDLPLDTLAAIVHFATAQKRKKKLRIMLFGELSLQGRVENLMNKKGKADKIKAFNIEPLSLEETINYLRHRFMKAGLTGDMPLTVSDVSRVHRLSGGLPGRVNRVAQQTMIDMMKANQSASMLDEEFDSVNVFDENMNLRWFAVSLFIAMIACSVWMYHGQVNVGMVTGSNHGVVASKQASIASSGSRASELIKSHFGPAALAEPVVKAMSATPAVIKPELAQHVANKVTKAVAASLAATVPQAVVAKTTLAQALATGNGYTLQVLAAKNYSGLPASLRGTAWEEQAQTVVIQNSQGQAMTLLLLGVFESREEAKAALTRLPAGLQATPWARSIESVKQAMQHG